MGPKRFAEKACIVTGGGSGIGRATSLRLAAEMGRVAVLDIDEQSAKQTAEAIIGAGGQSIAIATDVSSSTQVRVAIKRTVGTWGRLDVIVNAAATMTFDPLIDTAEDDFDRVIAVNLRSAFLFAKHGIPHMPSGAAMVNLSSVHAHRTTGNVAPYAASKGGLEAMVRALSVEVAERGIRINCVAPGAVDTPMLWNNPNVKAGVEKMTGAVGTPESLAAAIAFLASDEADFITGTTLIVDGGRLARL